jgi:hypothetical protein
MDVHSYGNCLHNKNEPPAPEVPLTIHPTRRGRDIDWHQAAGRSIDTDKANDRTKTQG